MGQTWICLGLALAISNSCLHFSICACHHCAGAMVISSVSFQVCRMIPDGIRQHQRSHTSLSDHILRSRPPARGAVGRGGAPPLRLGLSLSVRGAPSWPGPTLSTGAPPPAPRGRPPPLGRCHKPFEAVSVTKTLPHRSHFGSRYKTGCCGHAGLLLFGPRFEPRRRGEGSTPHFVQKSKRPRPTAGGIGGRVGATH